MKKLLSLIVAMTALTMLTISGANAGGSDRGQKYNPAKRYSSMMSYKRHRPHHVIVKKIIKKKVIVKKHFKKNNHKIKKLIRKIKYLKRHGGNYRKIKHLKKLIKRLKHKNRGHKRIVRKKVIFKKVRIVRHSRPCGNSRYVVKHKFVKIKKNHHRKPKMGGERPKRPGGEGGNRNRRPA